MTDGPPAGSPPDHASPDDDPPRGGRRDGAASRRRPDPVGRPVTLAYLERAALHYLDRYASSSGNLRRVLARKARRRLGPPDRTADPDAVPGLDLDGMIAEVVERVVRSGLVDDRAFAEMSVGSLVRRGTSRRSIAMKLKGKGVADGDAAAALAASEPDDLALARRHAERKRLGCYRLRPDPALRERDLAALCRAGFPFRIARQALEPPEDDEG